MICPVHDVAYQLSCWCCDLAKTTVKAALPTSTPKPVPVATGGKK